MAIYFIRAGNFIKIGYAENPERRLKDLQTGSPHKLEMMAVIDGDRSAERMIHELFADFRVNGEWFELVTDILAYANQRQSKQVEAEEFKVISVVKNALRGWRLERNSNGHWRYRWQMKRENGESVTYTTETGRVGYRRGSKYVRR